MWRPVLAISLGAALGALLRWQLGLKLNSMFASLPAGTLVANLLGSYVIGLALAYLATAPQLSAQWRLFIITGFCGGLTTFSTFSAEVATLLTQGHSWWALRAMAAHVLGSLGMTLAGIASWNGLHKAWF